MTDEAGEPIRVLHVEDDRAFADLAAEFLERENPAISVTTAGDADAGLEHLDEEEVDCVVSDFDMPGADGLEFLEAVRERHQDLPFILFTGKGSEEVASEAVSAGVTDYLQKETGSEQYAVLANRIENAVEKHRVRRELKETRRRYELLGRASADAFWDWDLRTGTVDRSDGFYRLFGYEESEIVSHTDWWRERLHPDDRERVTAALDGTIERGEDTYEADYRFRNADGSYSYVYSRGFVVYEDDEPVRVVGSMTDVTGVRERERELEAVRSRLELALHGTETGVWERDPETGAVHWDETVEALFGLDPGEFEGTYEAFLRRVHPDDRERVAEQTSRTLETGQWYREEFRIVDEDGAVRWVESKGVRDTAGEGDETRLIGLISDVTERKEREVEARRNQRRFQALFDDPDAFIGLLSPDGTVLMANETALGFVGAGRDDIEGTPFPETPWWEHSEALQDEIRQKIERAASGEFVRFDATHYGADGQRVVVDGHLRPVTDDEGSVVSLLVEGIDVTERHERERMIESLHQATRDLVRAEDRETVATRVAQAAADVLGYPINVFRLLEGDALRPVAVSESARDLFDPRPVYDIGEGPAGEAFERREPVIVDDLQAIDDGYDRGSLGSGVYLPIGGHGTLSIADEGTGVFDESDVYLARILTTNAAAVLDRLEGEQALRRREDELVRQNERLERFAAVLSHDLRSPLAVARGRLDLVDEDDDAVSEAREALDRMDDLIDDVLHMATEGRLVDDAEPIDVAEVARSAWSTVETAGATLVVDGAPTVAADTGRLRELLENLFRNAVEHGVPGEGAPARTRTAGEDADADGEVVSEGDASALTVTVGTLDDGHGFFVADDGRGIPADDRETVLEPGYTTREEGTGFGLAIVAEIARAHDWEIAVTESAAGGTRVEFRALPGRR